MKRIIFQFVSIKLQQSNKELKINTTAYILCSTGIISTKINSKFIELVIESSKFVRILIITCSYQRYFIILYFDFVITLYSSCFIFPLLRIARLKLFHINVSHSVLNLYIFNHEVFASSVLQLHRQCCISQIY